MTVTVYVPTGVAVVVATVNVEVTLPLAAGVTDPGAKEQVTVAFTGAIVQDNATARLKPFNDVTVTVEVAEFPEMSVPDTGAVLTPKSFTVSE